MVTDGWVSLLHPRAMPPTRPATPTKEDVGVRGAAARDAGWLWIDRRTAEPHLSPQITPSHACALRLAARVARASAHARASGIAHLL